MNYSNQMQSGFFKVGHTMEKSVISNMCFSSFAQLPQRLKSTVFEKISHSGAALIEKISQNIDFRIFLHKLPTHFPSFSLLWAAKAQCI